MVIRSLVLHSIQFVLSKYNDIPSVDKLISICNSTYDSHSPYIVKEQLTDLRNRILGIDKQLVQMLGLSTETKSNDLSQINANSISNNIKQTTPQFNDNTNTKNTSPTKLQRSKSKRSQLIAKCKEINEESYEDKNSLNSKAMTNVIKDLRNSQKENIRESYDNKAIKKKGKYIQKIVETEYETKTINEVLNKKTSNSQKKLYQTYRDYENVSKRNINIENCKRINEDENEQDYNEESNMRELSKNLVNTKSREAALLRKLSERNTMDSAKELMKTRLKPVTYDI